MRISDWSSDVCSSDLGDRARAAARGHGDPGRLRLRGRARPVGRGAAEVRARAAADRGPGAAHPRRHAGGDLAAACAPGARAPRGGVAPTYVSRRALANAAASRSEEHTSELQSLMRISYAVCCVQKKKTKKNKERYEKQKK